MYNTRELEEVFDIIEQIPTKSCGRDQPKFLFDLSFCTKGRGSIVELGSLAGRSTISLAYGQKAKFGQPIYAIDCILHPDIINNLERAGVSEWVNILTGYSSQISKIWSRPIELLFIDANHSYLAVRNDIRFWSRHVIDGGYIVFHDYGNPDCPGVHRAVHRKLLSRPFKWKIVSDREVGSLYVLKKQPNMKSSRGLWGAVREELSISKQWLVGEVFAIMQKNKEII